MEANDLYLNKTLKDYSDEEPEFKYSGCELCNDEAGRILGNNVVKVKAWESLEEMRADEEGNAYTFNICWSHVCKIENGE